MKKILSTILSMITGNIIKDLGEAMDKNFTSKEEKLEALNEKERIYNERLKAIADMTEPDPDSWLSKNVRPLLCLIGMITISLIMVFNLDVDEVLKTTYVSWVGGMITFYFGIREVIKARNRKKNS